MCRKSQITLLDVVISWFYYPPDPCRSILFVCFYPIAVVVLLFLQPGLLNFAVSLAEIHVPLAQSI
jgi:hypothetical protein